MLLLQTDTKTQFRASLTPTYTSVSSRASQNTTTVYLANTSCPYDTRATLANRGSLSVSNKHVPGRQDSTTWNRFMWVVQYAVGQVSQGVVVGSAQITSVGTPHVILWCVLV